MKKSGSAQLRAWLDEQVQTGRPGSRLPADRELVRTFGISLATVRRVLTRYRDAGKLVRVQGMGTLLPDAGDAPHTPLPAGTAADDLAGNFKQLIRRGTLKNNEFLPPAKTVTNQYRVAPGTVTAAYRILVADGFAHRIGHRYIAGTFTPFSGTGPDRPVHFFYDRANSPDTISSRTDQFYAYVKMERELLTYGYKPYYHPLESLRGLEAEWLESRDYPAGVVTMVNFHQDIRPYENLLSRIHAMSGGRTAQLCLTQNLIPSLPGTDIMLIRQHSHTTQFRLLCSFLLGKQRTSAAVFYDQSVKQIRSFGTQLRLGREMGHLDPAFRVRYCVNSRFPGVTAEEFVEQHVTFRDRDIVIANLRKYGPGTMEGITGNLDVRSTGLESFFPDYLPFDTWIFPRADHADRALTWLGKNGQQEPGRILVISLENDPRFLHRTITTVSPDWETIGYVMAHAVIRDIPLERTSRGHLRTAAFIKDYSEA